MKKTTIVIFVLFTILFCNIVDAQSSSAFSSFRIPHSVKAFGMGYQGVASLNSGEAMQYNPAGLVNSDSLSFSYFNYPYMHSDKYRMYSFSYSMRFGKYGSLGIEYSNMDLGKQEVFTSRGNNQELNPYEKSISVAYANRINKEFSVGAEIKFAWEKTFDNDNTYFNPLISMGVMYQPEVLKNRLNLGFSLTNFGSAINTYKLVALSNDAIKEEKFSYTVPANFNLGAGFLPVTNNFFDLNFEASVSKPLEKGSGFTNSSAQSSFASLFNTWKYFPKDVTSSIGVGYIFHPIYLGNDISFIQEMYLGYKTVGPKDGIQNRFTHSFKIGLDVKGIKAMVGYAGLWHNNSSYYLFNMNKLPNENFEFSLSTDLSLFGKHKESVYGTAPLNIILSTGYSFGSVLGKMKEQRFYSYSTKFDNNNNWQVSADFYVDENSAITTSFIYSKLTEKNTLHYAWDDCAGNYSKYDTKVETFSLESGYRYHPLKMFRPLFVQASIGIIRLNPVTEAEYEYTNSKYYYKTYSRISTGCVVPLGLEKIVLIPKISLRTIFMENFWSAAKLLGFNQIEYGINIGYSF